MRPRALALGFLLLAIFSSRAQGAARYPRVHTDEQGTWVATDHTLLQIVGDLWIFYGAKDGLPADRVRKVDTDTREVWAATPRGLGRMNRSSRRWEAFGAPGHLRMSYAASMEDLEKGLDRVETLVGKLETRRS